MRSKISKFILIKKVKKIKFNLAAAAKLNGRWVERISKKYSWLPQIVDKASYVFSKKKA